MKLFLKLVFAATLIAATSPSFAHGDKKHSHEHEHKKITPEKAQAIATKAVSDTANKGKLEQSWAAIKPNKPTMKDFGHGKEYIVTFDNAAIKDVKKKKLYVFVSSTGKPLGLNFTGN